MRRWYRGLQIIGARQDEQIAVDFVARRDRPLVRRGTGAQGHARLLREICFPRRSDHDGHVIIAEHVRIVFAMDQNQFRFADARRVTGHSGGIQFDDEFARVGFEVPASGEIEVAWPEFFKSRAEVDRDAVDRESEFVVIIIRERRNRYSQQVTGLFDAALAADRRGGPAAVLARRAEEQSEFKQRIVAGGKESVAPAGRLVIGGEHENADFRRQYETVEG